MVYSFSCCWFMVFIKFINIMKIKNENPPNSVRQHCERVFNLSGTKPIFSFGDTIYNPFNAEVDAFLMAHEVVHSKQQGLNNLFTYYYSARVTSAGIFIIPPIAAECMYDPTIASAASSGHMKVFDE